MSHRLAPTCLLLMLLHAPLIGSGCASSSPSADPAPSSGSTSTISTYRSSVARSELRERAIAFLSTTAQGTDPQLRANAIEGMLPSPSRAEPLIALGLKDDNLGVRSVAAMAAGRIQTRSMAASLRPLLTDQSPYVRAAAIYALIRLGESVDPAPLATMLLTDPSPRVRAHAAFLLGELRNRSASGMLRQAAIERMSFASPEELRLFQLQLAEALIKLGEESQVQTVRAALYPSRPEELEAAALAIQIIGEVKDRGAIDQLIYLDFYKDETGKPMPPEIRLAIAAAMAKMGMREGVFIANEFKSSPLPTVRAQAASVYGETGQIENLVELERMMEDPSGLVQVAAAAAIVKITSR